ILVLDEIIIDEYILFPPYTGCYREHVGDAMLFKVCHIKVRLQQVDKKHACGISRRGFSTRSGNSPYGASFFSSRSRYSLESHVPWSMTPLMSWVASMLSRGFAPTRTRSATAPFLIIPESGILR